MGLIEMFKDLIGGRSPAADRVADLDAQPAEQEARDVYRFTELEAVLRGDDALHAIVVTGAFCDCMLRIVARQKRRWAEELGARAPAGRAFKSVDDAVRNDAVSNAAGPT